MKKEEFLNKLRKRLDILEEKEVEDLLSEYEGYIDEKIEAGASEEEAVNSFGDIDELADELLKAYKVKVPKNDDPIGNFANKVVKIIDRLIQDFSKKSPKEIAQFVIEIFLILLLIGLCHIPVSMLVDLGSNVFNILSSPLNRIFYTIWSFVLEFAYCILAIVVFVRIFNYRYLQNVSIEEEKKEEPKEYKKKEKPKKEKVVQEVCVEKRKSGLTSFSEFIIKIGVFFLKFLAICILFGVSVYLIGMGIVLAICVYLLIQGVTYFGFYLVMLSLFILGIIFFWLLFNFVLDRKNHGLRLAVSLLVSFTLLGVGCGVATLEVAETEFINSPPSDITTEVMQEELVMNEDTIFIGNISDYVVDNSLENVLVEYRYYPLGNKMATNIHKDDDFVYLDWSLEKIYLRQELLSHFINDLKEKKVYNYYIEPTIVITANEQNIETIKENRQKYYQNETNYSSCDFVRTYFVEMIKESDDGEDYTVVLSEYLSDDLTTVRLDKDIATDLKVGFYYEFTFKTYQAYIDTDIENIFDENEVVSVKETDKVGVNQIQQDSCSIFY